MANDPPQGNEKDTVTLTEQALRASELSYRRLFEAAQDGILILDADTGRVNDVNPFLTKLLGFSHAEMVGQTVGELSPFKDLVSNQIMLERLQQNGYIRYEDLPLETRDGRKIAVEFVCNIYQVGDKKVIQCNIRDITARKRAEETQTLLATAIEQAAETIVITDTHGTIQYANPAFERISGYTRDEAIGQNPRVLKSGKHDAAFYRQMWDVLDSGQKWSGHFVNRRKDGTIYEEDATISPVRDKGGRMVNFVAVKRDVTREMKLEAQFHQAQKMESIGQLAGGVAHDFNNILAVIQMQCDSLKIVGHPSAEQLECAEEISAAAQRGAALTRQLLLFSRKQTMQPRDLDLNQSINDVTKMLHRVLGADVQMRFKFAKQPLFIHADAGMMDQVLMNLAVNSRDAMPGGGMLVIETSAVDFDESVRAHSIQASPGAYVCLSVSDTGCGIPSENLPRIFEPFFTTKDAGNGTGLGLATVFGIVQQHRGWVNVYSDVGHGTTFRIYLPRLTSVPTQESKQSESPALCGGGETILVVEDDAFLGAAARKTLSQCGYRVLAATDGAQALAAWQENRDKIDLLLTDLVLPGGMSGMDLSARLLMEDPKLKVIYASGHSAEIADKGSALNEGVNFLSKPFPAGKLAQTIRRTLDAIR
jgi:PAS domain S-box-containing protein